LTAAYVAAMFLVVRPIVRRLAALHGGLELRQGIVAAVFVGLLAAAFTTEWIGIHALFGAFSFGACIPHDSQLARSLRSRIQDVAVVLLLPAFFAFTGMRTRIGLVSGLDDWIVCGVIVGLATLGKFGGSFVAARVTGLSSRDSAAIGVLMNTRGLMELIVLNVGLDMGAVTPRAFTMLVIMAVVTTLATSPALAALGYGASCQRRPWKWISGERMSTKS
jgi:Kef-type K+ transport system membrane component KefB